MRHLSIVLSIILSFVVTAAYGQIQEPVKWEKNIKLTDDTHGTITFKARIESGWHMYADKIPNGGPKPFSIDWKKLDGVKLDGHFKSSPAPRHKHDPIFEMDLSWWTGQVTITQPFTITAEKYTIGGDVWYNCCNDQTCIAPTNELFSFTGKKDSKPQETDTVAAITPNDSIGVQPVIVGDSLSTDSNTDLWAPVQFSGDGDSDTGGTSSGALWYLFFSCFLGGLIALLTPCVWPIIPLTVSFFLKKSCSRKKSIRDAIAYGLAIIIIYVLLGLIITGIFGASKLNDIATNAVCNIIFFLLLLVFGISFLGAFDIKLPDSWSNKLDSRAETTTGFLSIFFMAFTLVIVSFSCTGPIIGTLLVQAANQGNLMGPAVGMFAFALALAIPFSIFALFPSMMKKLPKSGSWMNTVKVVLGFIELALSLKFLSVADMAYGWHILDRETFLALWIAIFGLLALYLLNIVRLKSDGEPKKSIGLVRLFCAMISIAFVCYLLPGLWGAPLKVTSAFVPPLSTQDFNLYGNESLQFDDYDRGMEAAARQGKPVFVDFSGFGCVNCRKMEGAVLDDPAVKAQITDNFITVRLMVDDKRKLPKPIFVVENGKQRELQTIGDKWSYLQRYKFNSNSQPYYVVLDPQGRLLAGPVAYDENIDRFKQFLNKGLK